MSRVLSDKELIARYKDDCFVRGLSPRTIDGYILSLKLFSSFLKSNGYSFFTVDREILKKYISVLRSTDKNVKTIKNRFSAFSSLYDYAVYEGLTDKNVVLDIRKRYLRSYKLNDSNGGRRKLISVKEMGVFVDSIFDIRDKAVALLFAKTGIRRTELINIDVDDVNWDLMSVTLKPTHKRSNRVVFFDYETLVVLKQWMKKRELCANVGCRALFVSYNTGERIHRNGVYNSFIHWAVRSGLHDARSETIVQSVVFHHIVYRIGILCIVRI